MAAADSKSTGGTPPETPSRPGGRPGGFGRGSGSFGQQSTTRPDTTRDYFIDDNGNIHEDNINQLAEARITAGCNPPEADGCCPDEAVTRAQMASFLARAVKLSYTSRDHFVDDEGNVHEENINRLAQSGMTLGCNPPEGDRFCPDDVVTRAQMASFLTCVLMVIAPV